MGNNFCASDEVKKDQDGKNDGEVDGNAMRYKVFNRQSINTVDVVEISPIPREKFARGGYSLDLIYFNLNKKVQALISKFSLHTWPGESSIMAIWGKKPVYRVSKGDVVYEGHYEANQFSGVGYLYKGGDLWVCTFENDVANGDGAIYFDSGDYFVGKIVQGKTVKGKMQYEDGSLYEGEFAAAGYRDGQGTLNYQNGTKYEGKWKMNQKDGAGVLIMPEMWKDGVKLEILPHPFHPNS